MGEKADPAARRTGMLITFAHSLRYDLGVGPGKFGVHKTDSTFALIQAHAKVKSSAPALAAASAGRGPPTARACVPAGGLCMSSCRQPRAQPPHAAA